MSSITTIQATDLITNSRADINNNFSALNTDKIETSVIDTDTTLAANSDAKLPTQKAVKAYVDSLGSITTGLQITTVNAGATINGATLPVPVYQNTSDNEVYACDGNDLTALKFIGFAVSNSTNGNPIDVKVAGIVAGFTGLDEGVSYYLSDTAGAIQNTPGTYPVLVGVAISTTQLVIQKGKRNASGVVTLTATGTTAITCGFRPSAVRVHATASTSVGHAQSWGVWTPFGGDDCTWNGWSNAPTEISGTNASTWYIQLDSLLVNHSGTITSVTDTGFTLNNTETTDGKTVYLVWEAEGEF